MASLTDQQIQFLDDLGKGPKGLRELMDDYDLSRREFEQWRAERAFHEALEEVFAWLDFVRETDVRVGATEALRRQRLSVCGGGDLYLSARQRLIGDGLWNKARQLYTRFPRKYGNVGSAREASPVHRDYLHEAHTIVQRMEELRRLALEAKAREKQAVRALPPPSGEPADSSPPTEEESSTNRTNRDE